ncbi:MAG TPA: CcdB family protein [Alphaproteobacteria bacterium]|nr:CcdB family protein [Alphaproteobacteria bacterium]
MAQFDVFLSPTGRGYVLDVQADLLRDLKTRLVVPLMLVADAPPALKRLHPQFEIAGRRTMMATQFMAAIPADELQNFVASLASERYAIIGAIDFLLGGI